ncbi:MULTISPECIES: DUF2635 domain-containing protein [Edwardsiella]|uniref:Bacteriophage protein n=2 Tax=Edwardsiella anguillarum TaxID=1821960 RepID=A0A076LPJ2_9GAMM|nr:MULTISPECIES: DUF2635 domain-containing protein [Edwardsiella]AIJ10530.1 bacteriophage protein [Edwardsiella anguillarum ET080813]KAB0587605.1 DUF2635 domain-containing protein [Edwardsiella anguillarum]UBU94570.1 DUF2635 domain-containing protein [Edwardsiella sp. LADL05-105]WHP82363.1 DUF2635 domain-containing protein [Edwardsiella anguillarum]WHP86162.1 DUF2635 domain-containing protein [Edwardsiella anguillarum]
MFVKPNNGLSVRCPIKGSLLPKDGAEVPDNTFWRRRLSDGDVVVVKSKATAKTDANKKPGGAE